MELALLLMMKHLPLGNIEDQHQDSPIAVEETIALLGTEVEEPK
jgi:hypothetical protein